LARRRAIFAANVVGYSKLIAEDETGTLAALKKHPRELFDLPTHSPRPMTLLESIPNGYSAASPSLNDLRITNCNCG
jgi:adenylate cyclase